MLVLRRTVRLLKRITPPRLRRFAEDRIFYAIFNSTRVTNDAYGWRPEDEEKKK